MLRTFLTNSTTRPLLRFANNYSRPNQFFYFFISHLFLLRCIPTATLLHKCNEPITGSRIEVILRQTLNSSSYFDEPDHKTLYILNRIIAPALKVQS